AADRCRSRRRRGFGRTPRGRARAVMTNQTVVSASMNRPYILIVDDEPDIRNIISDILGDEGFETAAAESAEQAREMVAEREPELVLLDIWMPGTDGISLLRELIAEGGTSSVIMISGHGTVETAVEAI